MYMHLISDMMFTVYWFTRVLNLYHNATRFVESLSSIQLRCNDPVILQDEYTRAFFLYHLPAFLSAHAKHLHEGSDSHSGTGHGKICHFPRNTRMAIFQVAVDLVSWLLLQRR